MTTTQKPRRKPGPKPRRDLTGCDDDVIARIVAGETYREIAAAYGIDVAVLHRWMQDDPQRSARARDALERSAEAWLDRGLATIESALARDGNIDPSAARAYAQECARRAAVRNPRYRDRVAHGGDAEAPPIRHAHQLTDEQLLAIAAGAVKSE